MAMIPASVKKTLLLRRRVKISSQSTKSGARLQFPPLDRMAKARAKGVLFFTDTGIATRYHHYHYHRYKYCEYDCYYDYYDYYDYYYHYYYHHFYLLLHRHRYANELRAGRSAMRTSNASKNNDIASRKAEVFLASAMHS